jgi:hypothetical protein
MTSSNNYDPDVNNLTSDKPDVNNFRQPIVSEEELVNIYNNLVVKSKEQGLNVYDTYISELRQRKLESTEKTEKHHIIPLFDGGKDDSENLIVLTIKEHVTAHWLRWKTLEKKGDKLAYFFRIGDTEQVNEARLQLVQEARLRDKEEGKGFFNSELQRQLGARGGSRGGKQNTPEQFAARQKVGLTYGVLTGLSNQSETLSEFVSCFSIWTFSLKNYKGRVPNRDNELYFLVSPNQSYTDIIKVLNKYVPNSINREEAFYKLVTGNGKEKRKQMYGWKIIKTLTRNEVELGLVEEFILNLVKTSN